MNKHIQAKLNNLLRILLCVTLAFSGCFSLFTWMFNPLAGWLLISVMITAAYAVSEIECEIAMNKYVQAKAFVKG